MTPASNIGHVRMHRKQVAVLQSQAKVTLALAGIRGGKSESAGLWSLSHAFRRPSLADDQFHFLCSPTYKMSKVLVGKVHKLLNDRRVFPVSPLIRYLKTDRVFELRSAGGVTRVMVMSMEDPGKWRGFSALSAVLDEPSEMDGEAYTIGLGRLADTNGPMLLSGTPDGMNWVYDVYEQARGEAADGVPVEQREVRVVHWSSWENPFTPREGLEVLARQYDAKTYQQEVLALFVKSSGRAYHAFDDRPTQAGGHVAQGARVTPGQELWVGQDFNVDPMASTFWQPMKTREGVEGAICVHERLAPDSDTHKLAQYLDLFTEKHRIPKERVIIYADASGQSRRTSAVKSDFQILRGAGYRVVSPKANPAVRDRVNTVNGLLRPRLLRYPRLVVSSEAPRTIESFNKQRWKPNVRPPELDKTQGFDHLTDGAGYMCWGRWPLKRKPSIGVPTRRAA